MANLYKSILYFNNGMHERINVGLIMFDDKQCIVDIKQSKMDFVKIYKPESYELFEYTINKFKEYYLSSSVDDNYSSLKRSSVYNNGIFKVEEPNIINIELNEENFRKFFDRHI